MTTATKDLNVEMFKTHGQFSPGHRRRLAWAKKTQNPSSPGGRGKKFLLKGGACGNAFQSYSWDTGRQRALNGPRATSRLAPATWPRAWAPHQTYSGGKCGCIPRKEHKCAPCTPCRGKAGIPTLTRRRRGREIWWRGRAKASDVRMVLMLESELGRPQISLETAEDKAAKPQDGPVGSIRT